MENIAYKLFKQMKTKIKNHFAPMQKFAGTMLCVAFLLYSCNKSPEISEEPEVPELPGITTLITKSVFSGYVQKGPYNNGSSITITLLDENLNQTGSVFSTQIIDNAGNFEQKNIEFASNFVELKADGYYFNEVKGETSNGSLTLYALADITDINSVNINVLTHLERQRIIYLIQNNSLTFSAAKKQARTEVLDIFKFELPDGVASESLNITDDTLLLAVSVIIQGQLSTGDMSELLANISSDIRTDGKLDNPVLWEQLVNNIAYLDLKQVISNMEKKYSGLGIQVNINSDELIGYVQQFKENCGFEQTLSFTYPEKGKYGPNILSDKVVAVKKTEWGRYEYSARAELPAGNSSLKIVIRSESGNTAWGGFNQGSDDNWLVSNAGSRFTLTVYESGKPADASFIFFSDFIIEFYENGATQPTKVKKMYIGGDAAEDDQHEREMLIAFYRSTNGNNWIKKDNWCSDKPISLWYGIKTFYHEASGKNRVLEITLPNNNLTGSAKLTDLKSLYDMNILNGNKIESLTIDNCGNEMPHDYLNGERPSFYHDYNYSSCNLEALSIFNSNGYISVNGNFSAETVTISNCNLSAQRSMYFNLPSTKIETLKPEFD